MDAFHSPRPARRPDSGLDGRGVTAVLGPTNTGKTFLAIERMVAHSSGVIGLPLRLLAREVYSRVVERVGVGAVALITGEEKIKPPNARYQVCTVEAMPRETKAAFVAIDEVQLAADLERGHIFTDRILYTRGTAETLLLGSSTMRGVLERMLPGIQCVTRPRLSQLLYAGSKKITRLPRRSALVAFSAEEVYAIAELIRRQRGGAAVVLGALSPRTRNAQVELYQNGEVDFLVATDAIGMGLNLDVDHVAFAQDWKYDGFQYRQLTPPEFGQIAGRAGRHVRDGTFGVTGRVDPMPQELVEHLESHTFQPVRVVQWRSRKLDFASIDALKRSLDVLPPSEELARALPSVDQRALDFLSRDEGVAKWAKDARSVELLWEACKLPDYRRIAPAQHAEIIASIYADLVRRGTVAEDYMASQVRRADSTEGDIDTLSQRIAEIRTWTYISHRPGWLADPTHWQENTKAIEDRLSDALHERLTKRFVDRRTSVLMKRLRENAFMEAEIGGDGTVLVEGHLVGELQGFRFTPDVKSDGPDAKAVRAAAQKALAGEYDKRAERFFNAPNGDLAMGSDGLLRWLGSPVASLTAGEDPLKPRIVILADDQLAGPARDRVAQRAERFVTYQVSTVLKPLVDLQSAEGVEGAAKGIAYRLYENFGLLQRRDVAEEVRSLDQEARAALRRLGVRFGAYHIFLPALVKPAPANLMTLLWGIANDGRDRPGFGEVTQLLATGRTSVKPDASFDPVFYGLAGYRVLGSRAVRIDILERLADLIRPALAWTPGSSKRPDGAYNGREFIVTPAMMSILGATAGDMDEILKGLGYRSQAIEQREVEAAIASQDEAASAAARAKAAGSAAAATEPVDAAPMDAALIEPATATDGGEDVVSEAAEDVASDAAVNESDATPSAENEPATADATVAEPSGNDEDEAPASDASEAVVDEVGVEATGEDAGSAPVDEPSAESETAASQGEATPVEAASAEAKPEEPPKLVLLWRPHRGENRGRPAGRAGTRPQGRGRGGAGAETGEAVAAPEARSGERRNDRPQRGGAAPVRADAEGRPRSGGKGGERDRRDGSSRGEAGSREERFSHGRGGKGGKPHTTHERDAAGSGGERRVEKPRAIDPDSPFAKLAALKDKLGK
ncbi:helicase-related protein [Aureimonas pseudogalii]|uniref:ATP-dependent RNA helicase SUPV3L1/SUV3 n=1 Tax=Aureimonas pseudogalii TaxID=1744844 RepID=A0A7W6E9P8_9HYPH|nr:helicase-related protein [Aureimonas pseudogalii]MBB3997312.1 ATP-dependent RNA helicase SUPV3L1/SUV3 [Aureimonas pseudogalii]